ncbi:hypothetical protein [Dactylosporangium sp. NPDC051541]|uniref:hypothetical protein n=1 Tax=Dactylosporangium sp. NPDC051541 TaxID=3363977 RepID=UPI0037AD40CA
MRAGPGAMLPARDYERMLDLVVGAITDVDEGRSAWPRVAAELTGSVDATLAGVFDIGRPGAAARRLSVWPAWVEGVAMSERESAAHPLVRHYGRLGERRTRTLQDVPDDCGWRTSPRYAAARAQLRDVTECVGVPLSVARGGFRFLILGRPEARFTGRQQAYLTRLQPVLTRLDGHLETLRRWRGELPTQAAADLATAHRITPRDRRTCSANCTPTDRLSTVLRAQRLGII